MNNTDVNIEKIIDNYGNDILRFCYLYLKDKHLAEDALQETLIKVYQKYPTYKQRSSEKTWIITIAVNVCKNYLRTAWFRKVKFLYNEKFEISDHSQSISYDDMIEQNELLDFVINLKPIYKEVVLLHYYQQFNIHEIANILGISEANVMIRLNRAKKQLKHLIERNNDDERSERPC